MISRWLAPLVGATLFAAPAYAQDNNLSGFRIEGRLAWDSSSARFDLPDTTNPAQRINTSRSENGVAYGAEVGYDTLIGGSSVLVGAYAGIDWSNNEACAATTDDDAACAEVGRNITAGVRAGYAVNPNVLIYARGGYSNGALTFGYDSDVDDDTGATELTSDTMDGWHAGGGAEVAFNRNLYARLDYSYTRYNTLTYTPEIAPGGPTTSNLELDRHQVFAGVGFRF